MARNDLFSMQRRPTNTAMTAPEPEWRENMRNLGLMLSGIWQDVRGDLADSFSDYVKWVTAGLRRAFSQRAE